MVYKCIPFWMQGKKDDQFDYDLRSKEEVYYQMFMNPPKFILNFEKLVPVQQLFDKPHENKNIFNRVKIHADMMCLTLFPLQLERLIFLLGSRYKNDMKLRIAINYTADYQTNIAIGLDMLRQIYLESLRAPIELANRSNYEKVHYYNFSSKLELEKTMKTHELMTEFMADKTTEEYKLFKKYYPKMLRVQNGTAYEKDEFWDEILDIQRTKFRDNIFNEHRFDIEEMAKSGKLGKFSYSDQLDRKNNYLPNDLNDKEDDSPENKKIEIIKKLLTNTKEEAIGQRDEKLSNNLSKEAYEMFYQK